MLIAPHGRVRANLLLHAQGWPIAADLDARVFTGQNGYGMAVAGSELTSAGARAIVYRYTRLLVGQQLELQMTERFAVRSRQADPLLPQALLQHLDFQLRPMQLTF